MVLWFGTVRLMRLVGWGGVLAVRRQTSSDRLLRPRVLVTLVLVRLLRLHWSGSQAQPGQPGKPLVRSCRCFRCRFELRLDLHHSPLFFDIFSRSHFQHG